MLYSLKKQCILQEESPISWMKLTAMGVSHLRPSSFFQKTDKEKEIETDDKWGRLDRSTDCLWKHQELCEEEKQLHTCSLPSDLLAASVLPSCLPGSRLIFVLPPWVPLRSPQVDERVWVTEHQQNQTWVWNGWLSFRFQQYWELHNLKIFLQTHGLKYMILNL